MSCGNEVKINNKEGIKKGGKKLEKVAIIKKARITGAEYVNHRGMLVPARGQGENCRCMFKCFERCTTKERQEILEKFRHLSSKNKQDSYLQSLLEFSAPKVKRPRNLAEPRPRSFTFKYYLNCINRIMVCKKAFVSIHAITPARVRRLGLLLTMGKEPDDKRGKNPSGNAIPEHKIQEIEEHIKSFPVKVYQDNKLYLNEQLNVKVMYKLFQEKFPDTKVSYKYYLKIFKDRFTLSFGRPQEENSDFLPIEHFLAVELLERKK